MPDFLKKEFGSFDFVRKCSICNMIIGSDRYSNTELNRRTTDFFFINGKEIFEDFTDLDKLNLTCEEFQIKLLLE